MKGCDADLLAPVGNVLRRQHGRVRRRLVAVGLDLHAASHASDGLPARDVSHVHKGVVKGGEDVGDGKDLLALSDDRAKTNRTSGGRIRCLFFTLGSLRGLLLCVSLENGEEDGEGLR